MATAPQSGRYGRWSNQIDSLMAQGRRNSAAQIIINRLRSGSLPGWAGGGPLFPQKKTTFAPGEGTARPDHIAIPVDNGNPEVWRLYGNANLGSILSALYAKLLVVMGIGFPMSEVISSYIPPSFYDGFYLYLYFMSIVFMIGMFVGVVKQRARRGITRGVNSFKERWENTITKSTPDVVKSEESEAEDTKSESKSSEEGEAEDEEGEDEDDTLPPLPSKQAIDAHDKHRHHHSQSHHGHGHLEIENGHSKGQRMPRSLRPLKRRRLNTQESTESSISTRHEQRSHLGSFYLRIGAVAFGIGSVIYSGLEFGQYFEIEKNSNCHNYMMAITPAVRMIFTFMQMYFIFLNSRMAVSKPQIVKQFGLMHMIGTNLCVWLNVLVQETKHEILHFYDPDKGTIRISNNHHYQGHGHNNTSKGQSSPYAKANQGFISTTLAPWDDDNNATETLILHRVRRGLKGPHSMYDCRRTDIMGSLVDNASPFLFPCTIEYSLICAAVCYVMWKNMAKRKITKISLKRSPTAESSISLMGGEGRSPHHYTVDCAGSNKGLFIGIFILVLTIMSLIINFVLVGKEGYKDIATFEVNCMEITLYSLCTLGVLIGMCQMRQLRYESRKNLELDNILLIVAQSGSFVFNVFCIIAAHLHSKSDDPLVLVTPLLCLIQLVLQTLFILDASKRVAANLEQTRRKPGREIITFLLVCNLAMWLINALEKSRGESHPLQLQFYGVWAWTIITDISMPLAIFYRFHSTVCLCEIWKKAYKFKHSSS